jgi:hypothetical protein
MTLDQNLTEILELPTKYKQLFWYFSEFSQLGNFFSQNEKNTKK